MASFVYRNIFSMVTKTFQVWATARRSYKTYRWHTPWLYIPNARKRCNQRCFHGDQQRYSWGWKQTKNNQNTRTILRLRKFQFCWTLEVPNEISKNFLELFSDCTLKMEDLWKSAVRLSKKDGFSCSMMCWFMDNQFNLRVATYFINWYNLVPEVTNILSYCS